MLLSSLVAVVALLPAGPSCADNDDVLTRAAARSAGASGLRIAPSALLALDQNRTTVVERIVGDWGDALVASDAGISREQLRALLDGLRADQLFAASLVGTLNGLRDVIATAVVATAAVKPLLLETKTLGDAGDDLVYTPVSPCRIADTRNAGGALAANTPRTFDGFSADFSTQGGTAGNCGMPNGVSAIAMNAYAVGPNTTGYLKLYPANGPEPAVSTVNYQYAFVAIATGTIVPVDRANSNRFIAKSSSQLDFIADVVGYFRPPGTPLPVTTVTAGVGLAGGGTSGTVSVGIANGGVGNTQLANSAVDVAKLDTTSTDARYFKQGGNAFGAPAIVGTTDAQPLAVNANGSRTLLLQPDATSPIVVAGSSANTLAAGASGGAIGGGGAAGTTVLGTNCGASCANRIADAFGAIGGGAGNQAGDAAGTATDRPFATVAGGLNNIASGQSSTVGGGAGGIAGGRSSTIAGGQQSQASADYSAIGGGFFNSAFGSYSVIAGGTQNTAAGASSYNTVGGGLGNTAGANASTVAGGQNNTANGLGAAAGGGVGNHADGTQSAIAGGGSNTASGTVSVVAGGLGNTASGSGSMVVGGHNNTAAGGDSLAAGNRANAAHNGAFVFADFNNFPFSSGAINEFTARATGGVRFVLAIDVNGTPTWTCQASNGTGWACSSDRNLKHDLARVDGEDTLRRLVAMPIYRWQANGQTVPHLGPMAQDFHAYFGLGDSDKLIGSQDADGVALAAIQGLNAKLDEEVAAQRREIDALRRMMDSLIEAGRPARR